MKTELFEVSGGGTASGTARQSYQLRGYGTTGDADTARERINAAAVVSPPGFVSRPVIRAGLRALGLIREDDSVTLLGLFDRAISHAVEVATGEARVFSPQTPAVCIRLLDGLIEIKLNTTGELRLGPDTGASYAAQSVARNTDAVNADGSLTAWHTAVTAKLNAPGPVVGGGIPTAPITIGTITGSTSKVKA